MFFLFYKFLFFFSDFLEIQRKSFYLFLNKKLGEEFSKIQPLHNSQKWTLYKNSKGLSTKGIPLDTSLQTKNFIKSSNAFFNQNRNEVDFSYRSLTNIDKQWEKQYNVHFQKMATPRTKDKIITIDFLYRNYKFLQPTLSIEKSILFSKTYCCHFYFPVRFFDHLTNNLVEIRWIFLGTLPLLTRRGHFIINGTPRVVLNQIIRSPGIYFHKERTESKKNSRLFYAEVISKSGPWIRIEIDYKKKIWIVFQQNRISLSYFFQNFDQKFLDHQIFLYEKKKKLNLSAILSNEFFSVLPPPKAQGTGTRQRGEEWQDLKKNIFNTGFCDQSVSHGIQKNVFSNRNAKANSKFKNLYEVLRKYLKFNWNRAPLLLSSSGTKGCVSRGIQAVNFPSLIGGQDQWLLNFEKFSIKNQKKFKNNKQLASLATTYDTPNSRLNFFPGKSGLQFTKSKQTFSNILFASSTKDTDLDLNLGPIGRMRLNKRLGLSLQTLTLTPMDFFAISDILYQLAKPRSPIPRDRTTGHSSLRDEALADKARLDDIDDLKNRRLKTIGELLQNQLARGLLRLQKIFENSLQKDWIKWNQTNSSSLSFLNSLNFEKKNIAKRGSAIPIRVVTSEQPLNSNFTKHKEINSSDSSDKLHISLKKFSSSLYPTTGRVNPEKNPKAASQSDVLGSFTYKIQTLKPKIYQKQLQYLLTKLHFKRNFIWHRFARQKQTQASTRCNGSTDTRILYPTASVFSLLNHLPINSTFKEFFHSHQLSQYLDQSNPLAEITHKRRFSCLGSGGINRETAGMEIRSIHLSHYGRICPIETPEGKNAGLVNSLTTTVNINNNGFLETPYIEIYKQHSQNQKKLVFFSAESQEKKNVFLNPKSPKLRNIAVGIIQSQTKNFYKCTLNFIQLIAFSPQQFLSIATTCIPFIEHDDANRALMGSNMQRQALPLIHLEQPIVTTLNAFRVLSDLKDIPTTSNSGVILYASQQKISFCLNLESRHSVVDWQRTTTCRRYLWCQRELRWTIRGKASQSNALYIQSPLSTGSIHPMAASFREGWIRGQKAFRAGASPRTLAPRPGYRHKAQKANGVFDFSILNLEKQKSIQQTISFFKDRKKF